MCYTYSVTRQIALAVFYGLLGLVIFSYTRGFRVGNAMAELRGNNPFASSLASLASRLPSVYSPQTAKLKPEPKVAVTAQVVEGKKSEAGVSGTPVINETKPVTSTPSEVTAGTTSITVTEAQVNELIKSIPAGTLPIQNLQVTLDAGRIILSGRITQPVAGNIQAEIEPVVIDQATVKVNMKSASLDGLPIPGFLLPSIETPMNGLIEKQLAQYTNYRIESLVISKGQITVRITLPAPNSAP